MTTILNPNPEIKKESGNIVFAKEVVKYFMDFLETDFHKRKNPKRSIKIRNNDNLLVGINLNKYPTFSEQTWELINKSFDKDELSKIGKSVYRTNLPKNLLDLIKLQIEKIHASTISELIVKIGEEIEKSATLHKDEYDKAVSVSLEATISLIKSELILPFIKSIEKTIENLGIGDEDDTYIMEEELGDIFIRNIESKVQEIIRSLISEEKVNIQKQLKSVFDLGEIKNIILGFFENFQVGDLFGEIFEMDRNRAILDKQDFYLYFCDITFNKVKFPIFYTPFSVLRDKDTFQIEFDSQIYINKKAIEFIVQEYNNIKGTKGNIKSIAERIIYLAQHKDDLNNLLSNILSELINFFGLDKPIDLSNNQPQISRGIDIRVSNNSYISLFDKSDEALVNDYEEILQELDLDNSELLNIFNVLVGDFIHNNPVSVGPEVEKDWDDASVPEKLVFASPIPLNSEQLQILSAVKKDQCKYIIVEGPPGTGKSHTITAVIFNAILNNQSVLVLSDKKEALDVVEDKITETMNRVRYNEQDFQNPILRLGKTGNTYSQILSKAALEKIKVYQKAVKKNFDSLESGISGMQNSLKEDLEAEILAYKDIDIEDIHSFYDLEEYYKDHKFEFDIDELSKNEYEIIYLEESRNLLQFLRNEFSNSITFDLLGIKLDQIKTPDDFLRVVDTSYYLCQNVFSIQDKFSGKLSSVLKFKSFSDKDLPVLKKFIREYEKAKLPLVGFLFSRSRIKDIDSEFRNAFPYAKYDGAHLALEELKDTVEVFDYINAIREHNATIANIKTPDYLSLFVRLIESTDLIKEHEKDIVNLKNQLVEFQGGFESYPSTLKKVGILEDDFGSWINNRLVDMNDLDFERSLKYAGLKNLIVDCFDSIPALNYANQKKEIETLVTTKVTHLLDTRLIDFYNDNKADAETLRQVIKDKKKFPREEFSKLKNAFPCILAGIRDYAEYIPLEPEIFDLVIIDEASQVSVAQAFPALIRAKKVLILGDRKQFSNIKATQAKSETNREYLNSLASVFKREISSEDSKLIKLSKFDIKTSILEFFEFISNYHTQLLKYFRGYKEIISYSNKYFYQDSLQAMKIRGKSVEDVIKFTQIEHDGKEELIQNTNSLEIAAIISELKALRDADKSTSVGIITPHTNQQKILMEEISKLPERDYYFEKLKLKIMTFDTCQGEERDIIFYSMVATETNDRLWGVFIKDFNSINEEEDGRIKVQRLNVGLSRAKECMHFFLSKPIDKFTGSIGDALRHYYNVLEEGKKEKTIMDVDQSSPMEKEVLNWFYQTEFWKKNKERIEFLPQFEIGRYLKQLDRLYQHPNYKVDFLLVYKDENHHEYKIVIEYDGFKEHFKNIDEVNEFNYRNYYNEDDLYREKVLESYGYRFLRINKFNIGENPISTLNERIGAILSSLIKNDSVGSHFLEGIYETVAGFKNGDKKECPKCKEVRESEDFKDPSLVKGYGRFCKYCKSNRNSVVIERTAPILSDEKCPRCSSRMVLRNSKRGKFYGCSRFPRCRGTKNIRSI